MIRLKNLNKEVIKPIPLKCKNDVRIKGFCLFPEIYSNIFLVAKKKSGKTSAINKILKECAGKRTKLYFFVSTIYKDDNWDYIVNYFKKKGNELHISTSLKEGLEEITKTLQLEDSKRFEKKDKDKEVVKPNKYISIDGSDDEEEDQPKKEKKLAPEHIFVFDDIGSELRDPAIDQLLKTNRHYKSKVILSSQYVNDLKPESRKQIDYWLLFKGHTEDKLLTIYKDSDINVTYEKFIQLYNIAVEKPYGFLYVDTRNDTFRRNFTDQLLLTV